MTKAPLITESLATPIDGSTAEDVLAGALKTSEETANQVRGHEDLGQLFVILVINRPDGVILGIEVLPEPLKGIWGIVVRVLSLPLINRQRLALAEPQEGAWPWVPLQRASSSSSSSTSFAFGLGCSLWCAASFFGACLLLWWGVLDMVTSSMKAELVNNGRVDWLVVDSLVPTGDIGVL